MQCVKSCCSGKEWIQHALGCQLSSFLTSVSSSSSGQTAPGDTSQARLRRWSGKAGERSGIWGHVHSQCVRYSHQSRQQSQWLYGTIFQQGTRLVLPVMALEQQHLAGAFQGPNPSLLQLQGRIRCEFACEKLRQWQGLKDLMSCLGQKYPNPEFFLQSSHVTEQ